MRSSHIATALTLLFAATSAAQGPDRESAVGTKLRDYGGFVGLDTRFGDMNNDFAMFTGGHAALLLKHKVYVGVGGAALTTEPTIGTPAQRLEMAYGGILIGYVVPMPGLLQLTADVLVGAGGATVGETTATDEADDEFFAFEPTLGVELKLARVLRVGFGASYRYIGGLDVPGMRDSDVRDLTVSLRIRGGWF